MFHELYKMIVNPKSLLKTQLDCLLKHKLDLEIIIILTGKLNKCISLNI